MTLLALIAGTVSYLHMHLLVELHGQPGWVAALTPLSVDGMIVAASMTLLANSRAGERGGVLPWALLVVGSVASLAANVAVAQQTVPGRVIAAWPSFALIGAYELLMRQVRGCAPSRGQQQAKSALSSSGRERGVGAVPRQRPPASDPARGGKRAVDAASRDLQRQAWRWALANRSEDGSLPSGREIGRRYGRHERWGRLVKQVGVTGQFLAEPSLRLIEQQPSLARVTDSSNHRE
jgi:hypothetical protein